MTGADRAWEHIATFRHHSRQHVTLANVARDLDLIATAVDALRIELVKDMRRESWSWAEVGDAFGISRQAARQRYGGYGIA